MSSVREIVNPDGTVVREIVNRDGTVVRETIPTVTSRTKIITEDRSADELKRFWAIVIALVVIFSIVAVIALALGSIGYSNSLKSMTGKQGPQGLTGIRGPIGPTGTTGEPGKVSRIDRDIRIETNQFSSISCHCTGYWDLNAGVGEIILTGQMACSAPLDPNTQEVDKCLLFIPHSNWDNIGLDMKDFKIDPSVTFVGCRCPINAENHVQEPNFECHAFPPSGSMLETVLELCVLASGRDRAPDGCDCMTSFEIVLSLEPLCEPCVPICPVACPVPRAQACGQPNPYQ